MLSIQKALCDAGPGDPCLHIMACHGMQRDLCCRSLWENITHTPNHFEGGEQSGITSPETQQYYAAH